jgi:hypothetical protein
MRMLGQRQRLDDWTTLVRLSSGATLHDIFQKLLHFMKRGNAFCDRSQAVAREVLGIFAISGRQVEKGCYLVKREAKALCSPDEEQALKIAPLVISNSSFAIRGPHEANALVITHRLNAHVRIFRQFRDLHDVGNKYRNALA